MHNSAVISTRQPSVAKSKGTRPPSTFGRDTDRTEQNQDETALKAFQALTIGEQRKLAKKYLDQKLKEIKDKYQSQSELTTRMMELIKIVRINEVSLNVDSLTGQKIDTKVAGIILAEVHMLQRVEILSDKVQANGVEKEWIAKQKKGKKDENVGKKISQSTLDTFSILDGLGRNMRKMGGIASLNDMGSRLAHLHIVNLKVNVHSWTSIANGL